MLRAEAIVDLDAIRDNVATLRSGTSAEVMAVVKADGYGHWDQLEQRNFRAEILALLIQDEDVDEDVVEQQEEHSSSQEGE